MISIADLLIDNRIPGNFYLPDVYVRGDLEVGLLENRQGDRLLAVPETLIQAIYAGLEKETGQAARLVLFNCGKWWGKSFYTRFCEQIASYYGVPLANMPMVEFLQALQECWIAHGWGKIALDQTYQSRGFLIVKIWNSAFARLAPKQTQPVCHLEAGILSSFFSQLSSKELTCVQTSCESMGADCNRFLLGLPQRLEPVETMVTALDHEAIMQRLC
jgi:predicted hydrocarbon binding protein